MIRTSYDPEADALSIWFAPEGTKSATSEEALISTPQVGQAVSKSSTCANVSNPNRRKPLSSSGTQQGAVGKHDAADIELCQRFTPLTDLLKAFWVAHPLPPPTGQIADEQFFDELSADDDIPPAR